MKRAVSTCWSSGATVYFVKDGSASHQVNYLLPPFVAEVDTTSELSWAESTSAAGWASCFCIEDIVKPWEKRKKEKKEGTFWHAETLQILWFSKTLLDNLLSAPKRSHIAYHLHLPPALSQCLMRWANKAPLLASRHKHAIQSGGCDGSTHLLLLQIFAATNEVINQWWRKDTQKATLKSTGNKNALNSQVHYVNAAGKIHLFLL